jgi:UDP-N-acetylmuramate: L-alanyl-gamma-D-glutamyl-meso-diaminopimelate ligase
VLEPRSNTLRRNVFSEALVESLALADAVMLASVFRAESIPVSERLHPDEIVAKLAARGIPAAVHADAAAIVAALTPQIRPGDVVAILSNGGFGGIYELLPAALRSLPVTAMAIG